MTLSIQFMQCTAIRESPSPCDSVSSDLMTTQPSIAFQLEKIENPKSNLSPDCWQTKNGPFLDRDADVDPVLVLRREFLGELQKVRLIPFCERQGLPRIDIAKSGSLKLIGNLNTIINSLKDEPDMCEIMQLPGILCCFTTVQ